MTPVAMNPSPSPLLLTDQIEDQQQHQLFVSSLNQESSNSLSSCPSFFHFLDQTQTCRDTRRELKHDQEEDELVFHGGSSSHQVHRNSSFNSPQPQQVKDTDRRNVYAYKEEEEEEESKSGYESAQWIPSQMRLLRKMMIPSNSSVPHKASNITPNVQTREQQKTQTQKSPSNHRNNAATRVCADCNTTSTPLWRGGPRGPKSLCNACGIRQRKARRALMAEAGNGSSVSCRVNSKEKKARANRFVGLKSNKCKASASSEGTSEGERKNVGFKDLAFSFRNNVSVVDQVFPLDEVAQAALLLMDLSYASVPI